jgi:hypothetical protein
MAVLHPISRFLTSVELDMTNSLTRGGRLPGALQLAIQLFGGLSGSPYDSPYARTREFSPMKCPTTAPERQTETYLESDSCNDSPNPRLILAHRGNWALGRSELAGNEL